MATSMTAWQKFFLSVPFFGTTQMEEELDTNRNVCVFAIPVYV